MALLKRHAVLTRDAFDKLLAALDPNRDVAAGQYERIRRKLSHFFEYRGCSSPEEYADITINCAATKLSEGTSIYSNDPLSFFMGIARNILKEYWEQAPKLAASLNNLPNAEHPRIDTIEIMQRQEDLNQSEAELKCLEECLERTGRENRGLIINYYIGEKGHKIRNRKRMAAELDIAPAVLRLRAFRLREKLESCVKTCFEALTLKQNHSYSN